MRKIKRYGIAALAIALMAALTGCASRPAAEDGISVMYLNTQGASGNGVVNPAEYDFIYRLDAWASRNPDVRLERRERKDVGDIGPLARLGEAHLPDVFIASVLSAASLARAGLICDLSPYAEGYDAERLEPFIYKGGLCALPALQCDRALVILDAQAWQKAGCAKFPENWNDLVAAAGRLKGDGFDAAIGIDPENETILSGGLLSLLLTQEDNRAWFNHIVEGDRQAAFTDDAFLSMLASIRQMLQSDVFSGREKLKGSLADAFANGRCAAVMVTGTNVYKVLSHLREKAPERYARLEFAALPWPGQPEGTTPALPSDHSMGLYIRSGLMQDPARLARCIELCRALTLPLEAPLPVQDDVLDRLEAFVRAQPTCPMCTLRLAGGFWSYANEKCFVDLDKSPEDDADVLTIPQSAALLQNYYEEYCLEVSDFSKLNFEVSME